MSKTVSIIIPVFNERQTILPLLQRVKQAATLGLTKEIIIVDDGSRDGTTMLLRQLSEDPSVRFVFRDLNGGKGTAIRDGLRLAKGDIILIQDADLEYDPADYPSLLAPLLAGQAPVVYGSRELQANPYSSLAFWLGGRMVTAVTNTLYGSRLTDVPTCYKAFRGDVLRAIPLTCKRFEFCPEVTAHLLRRNIPIHEIPISYVPRSRREGKKINPKDGLEALWVLLRLRLSRAKEIA